MFDPKKIVHPIEPFYTPESEILILGSFPSVKTREMGFFYGHPQNRFWKVAAAVFGEPVPMTIEERRKPELLNASRRKRIAQGSGQTVAKVNQLIKKYEDAKKRMKQMNNPQMRRMAKRGGGFKLPF
jgi:G:T/U-mismatch repair DNA glycosylase